MIPSHEFIAHYDPELASCMGMELQRQRDHLELIASENFVSPAVLAALGSPLTNKYAEGYPGHRYYGGCEYVDMVEDLARERAKALFHADHANVQPHAGSQANLAVYYALLNVGDTVLSMNLNHGGHLTHGHKANASGRLYNFVQYGVREDTGCIDYDELERLAHEQKPKLIVAGASAYSRIIDFECIGRVAKDVGAYFMVDMAHISGLIAAGEHPNMFPYADVATSTTHKTLRGARGGLILCKEEFAKKIDKAIFPGMQGGPLMHVIAAKAVCFHEAMQPEFKTYQHQIVLNAAALCETLQKNGIQIVSGGTDTHLMLVDLRELGVTGMRVQTLLDAANITANRNAIPFDTRNKAETSGVRFGTPAVTTRGMKEAEMRQIGEMIVRIIKEGESAVPQVKQEVLALCKRFPLYE
ncbi:MAG TPA: serine hydroxymethyltransferase [Eubacteriales bacterium]|nr:serine hydroxymethyltransferase [Eubacteriales bacterium]